MYTLQLTKEEIQTLSMALGELPLKVGVSLFAKLQNEVAQQDKAREAKPESPAA